MGSNTLESYFIEDYANLKDRCKWLEDRLREYEAKETDHEYGITDLHQRFLAVKGGTCSKWVIKEYLLENGKMTPERMRETMALDDETLFRNFKGRTLNYYSAITYEEHEFQYTLHIRESRDEWTAVTDGKRASHLQDIRPRELGEDLCEDEWYPIEEAEALRTFLAQNLRETMEEVLDEYEREQAEEEEGSDDSAS